MHRSALILLVPTFFATSCGAMSRGGTEAVTATLVVSAVRDDGVAVAGASVFVGDTPLGKTSAAGGLALELSGAEGDRFAIGASCPDPLRLVAQSLPEIVLSEIRGYGAEPAQLELVVTCQRPRRSVAVLVRARGEILELKEKRAKRRGKELRTTVTEVEELPLVDVSVLLNGQLLAKTDADGLAHLAFEVSPSTSFELTLDTASAGYEELVPHNPTATFDVRESDELYVFDQVLRDRRYVADLPPAPKPRRVRRSRPDAEPEPEQHRIKILRGGIDSGVHTMRPK